MASQAANSASLSVQSASVAESTAINASNMATTAMSLLINKYCNILLSSVKNY